MKKILTILGLLILVVASTSCNREKTEYGEGNPSPTPIVGVISFETMHVTLDTATETVPTVVRPETTTTTAADPVKTENPGTRAETDALEGYLFNLIDKQGNVVAEFPYDARPRFEVPTGAYTLTVQPAAKPAFAWEQQSYAATQEVFVRKDATTEIGEVLCTPATVGVSLIFESAYADTSTATVTCNGEEALFTPSEHRTAYFLPAGSDDRLNISVSGQLGDGSTIRFTQSIDGLRAGREYQLTVKGSSVAAPVIEWEGHDIMQRYEATAELQAKINITAAAGIRDFKVEIISEVLTPEILQGIGLTTSFDLIHPGQYEEVLKGLGFPTGDAVLNQTSVSFDISPFMPLIPLLGSGDSDFKLTVTDNDDATTVASIMVHSTAEGETPEPDPDPDGPEQEFPGGGAGPLDPPSSGTQEPFPGGSAGELH